MVGESEIVQRAMEWANSRLPDGFSCPACGRNQWTVVDGLSAIVSLRPTDTANLVDFSKLIPVFTLVCTNCGNVQFFSAKLAGLMAKAEDGAPGNGEEGNEHG